MLQVNNVTTDKENYIFGIDTCINLSFDIYSDIFTKIKSIRVIYGAEFSFLKSRGNYVTEKIYEKQELVSHNIISDAQNNFSFSFANKICNVSDSFVHVENFIEIHVQS